MGRAVTIAPMRRRPSRLTLVLAVVLCAVIAIACIDFVGSGHHSHTPPVSPRPAAAPASSPQFAEDVDEVAQATTSFGLNLTPETILFGRWWSGIAEDHKAGPYLGGPGVYAGFPDPRNWPFAVWGRRFVVIGRPVIRHDFPVFHVSKEPLPPGVAYQAGIPVPQGTDLYKASERTVIEDPHWLLVPETH